MLMDLDLKPGDVFLVQSPGWVSRWIMAIQRFWSADNAAKYTHSGIITTSNGNTIEMVGKGVVNALLSDHGGKPILIARHDTMDLPTFAAAIPNTHRRLGESYPVYRMLFHLFPPLAKCGVSRVVCSELVAEFLYFSGIIDYWPGVNPDELEEMFRNWKGFEIVYEGNLPDKEKPL
jgi:hypothetical protein